MALAGLYAMYLPLKVRLGESQECCFCVMRCMCCVVICLVCCTGGSNNPSLWVGTNGGHVYVYSLTVPGSDKRSADAVGCVLAKEIKLKHHAPVISIAVIDSKNRVLPEALEVINERAKAPDMEGQHSVVICSEEQLKV